MIPNLFILNASGCVCFCLRGRGRDWIGLTLRFARAVWGPTRELIMDKQWVPGYKKTVCDIFWDETLKYDNREDVRGGSVDLPRLICLLLVFLLVF